tara:strand:+ start:352 stop:1227 length:876 start_codon:yes stop_codon:yes gene_type:complete
MLKNHHPSFSKNLKQKVFIQVLLARGIAMKIKKKLSKISNKKPIYGYVRCEEKTCINKYKLLKVPKILIGIQQCQICKNIMQQVEVNKTTEVIQNNKTKSKAIYYINKNFDAKKFDKIIDTYKEDMVDEFCNFVLKCVKGYNPKNVRDNHGQEDDHGIFLEYLGELLKTGKFFLKFKKDFKIEKYFCSVVVEDTLWTEAYILFSKNKKKYRLILVHYGQHPGQDSITLMSTKSRFNLDETLKELNDYNQQYHDIDRETPNGASKLNAPDFKVCKPFELGDSFNLTKRFGYI